MRLLISRIILTFLFGYLIFLVWNKNVDIVTWFQNKSKGLLPITEDKVSQSTRATAIRSAAAELEQIADNFEIWAEKERAKYIDPNGVTPPAFNLAQVEDWVNTYLLKQRLVAVFFNHPHLSYNKNSGLTPFLTTREHKEFHLIIDVFRLYMPSVSTSLK